MRSAPVQVVCRGCSVPFRTTVRGSGTRCARCGVQRYVRRRQEWEGPRDLPAARHPALDRAPVWCGCRCGHEWESLAADRASIRCPSCRHSVRVPRRLKELNANISAAREELTVRLSRAPRPSEIAHHLGVPMEDVYEGLRAGQGRYGASLDNLLENSAHTRFGAPDSNLGQAELREALRPMLESLPERERKIVALRFGSGMSQSDIARRVGVSQMQVSRLLAATLKKLRTGLVETDITEGT